MIADVSDRSMPTLRELLAPGAAAVRKFWRPFLLLQGCALLLVATYLTSAAVQAKCRQIAAWHDRGGLLLSGLAAAIAGGLLPEAAKLLAGVRSPRDSSIDEQTAVRTTRWNDIAFACAAFFVCGIIVDIQYRGLGAVFGDDGRFVTALKKMLADQFITTPIYGITFWAVAYRWRALGYSLLRLAREMGWRWYVEQVGPLLLPCWGFWIPMALLIYLMPGALQFALYCFALAAWSLLMVFIATRVEDVAPAGESTVS